MQRLVRFVVAGFGTPSPKVQREREVADERMYVGRVINENASRPCTRINVAMFSLRHSGFGGAESFTGRRRQNFSVIRIERSIYGVASKRLI